MICLPRIKEALCRIGPGFTLRSLMAISLSKRKPAKEMSQAWMGMPMRNMSITSRAECTTKSRKEVDVLHCSQGMSSSGTPSMKKTMSSPHHLRHDHTDSSSSMARL